jgi:hypothetical protein
MFTLGLPWWEFVVRGALVYIFLLSSLLTGKRNTGSWRRSTWSCCWCSAMPCRIR